ncbi:MAG: hypothetical protein HC890_20060 [Chloroflexaceae bacterium]|nr:hypothetical protein [Chloroflexaceae bacterium]
MKTSSNQSEPEETELIQQEILLERKFSLAELIGREGGSFLKGESPVPKLVQVLAEINLFIDQHLVDSSGALQSVLKDWVKNDEARVSRYFETPLAALGEIVTILLENPPLFYEFVRQVDIRWGQLYRDRPYFQRPGQAPHPDDEYTHESVHQHLRDFLQHF